MIISVHIPKCAGTTFHHVLRAVYGQQLWLNYGSAFSRAQARPDLVPASTKCIHGHFLADTFLEVLPDATLITWVRDPVERVVSNYYQLLRSPDMRDDCCRLLHENKLSLLQFAELEWMQNTMTRYFAGRKPTDFAVIGVAEHFDESLAMMIDELELERKPSWIAPQNTNPERHAAMYSLDSATRKKLASLNEADFELYREITRGFRRRALAA